MGFKISNAGVSAFLKSTRGKTGVNHAYLKTIGLIAVGVIKTDSAEQVRNKLT